MATKRKNVESPSLELKKAAKALCRELAKIDFSESIEWIYNPLVYAWGAHEEYIDRYTPAKTELLFLGMNPGPWGMAQTGVPFGEVAAVRDWLGIRTTAKKPSREHPKRPIDGLACTKSEVSGRRLWGLFRDRYQSAENFFQANFVANYCPLAFMSQTAANVTPDKLPVRLRSGLEEACDRHLYRMIEVLRPRMLIGIGGFAEESARRVASDLPDLKIGRILHPSPASPAANRGWDKVATSQLENLGVW